MTKARWLFAICAVCFALMAANAEEYCKGSVSATWDGNGRTMTLLADYRYVDQSGKEWIAPKGISVDGASIPKFLWSIIGGPFEGLYRNASVTHDYECKVRRTSWERVHKMFYEHMVCSHVAEAQAKLMYW